MLDTWLKYNPLFRLTISVANSHVTNASSCAPVTVARTLMLSKTRTPDLLPKAANAPSARSPKPCASAKRRCPIRTALPIGRLVTSNTAKPRTNTSSAPTPNSSAQPPTSSIALSVASSSPPSPPS